MVSLSFCGDGDGRCLCITFLYRNSEKDNLRENHREDSRCNTSLRSFNSIHMEHRKTKSECTSAQKYSERENHREDSKCLPSLCSCLINTNTEWTGDVLLLCVYFVLTGQGMSPSVKNALPE